VYPESTLRASPRLGLPTTLYSSQHDSRAELAGAEGIECAEARGELRRPSDAQDDERKKLSWQHGFERRLREN
jgi:hypothetical protein